MSKNEEKQLLGNKQKLDLKEEKKEQILKICNLCKMEKSDIIKCKKCNKYFCYSCLKLKMDNQEKYEILISKQENKTNWICFDCTLEKCIFCEQNSNLINYKNTIEKLSYSEEEKNRLKDKDEKLKKIIINNKEQIFICNSCVENNNLVKQFLNNKPFESLFKENKKIEEENQTKENIFNILDKQIENVQSKKINQNNNLTNIKNENLNSKDLNKNYTIHYPIINNINKGISLPLNLPKNNLNLNDNNLNNQNNLNFLPNQIPEILNNKKNDNESTNKDNNNNVNNINNIDINKEEDDTKEENLVSLSSIKNYMMSIIDDLKNQINIIQYNNQIQKYSIGYIMEYIKLFMEQINNQNFIQPKNNIFPNQLPNNNIYNMNLPIMNPHLINNNNIKQINIPIIPFPYPSNIPPNIINLNQNKEEKENNFNVMYPQNKDNKEQNLNNLNMMFPQNNNLPLDLKPILQVNNQYVNNQNLNNSMLNPSIMDNNLFRQLNNQNLNPQPILFNNESLPNSNNINPLPNIGNLNTIVQNNPLMFQMVFNQNNLNDNNMNNINNINNQLKKEL